jgi:hypothetical protein
MSRDARSNCGSETFGEGHFAISKLWCAERWSGSKPPVAMPPNARQRVQIARWIAPRTGTPPRQLSFATRELVKPGEGVSRGS